MLPDCRQLKGRLFGFAFSVLPKLAELTLTFLNQSALAYYYRPVYYVPLLYKKRCSSRSYNRTPPAFSLYRRSANCQNEGFTRIFADGTNISCSSNNLTEVQNHMISSLVNLSRQLIDNKLSLNIAKTEFMVIGSYQRLATFNYV